MLLHRTPSVYPVGKTNLSFKCRSLFSYKELKHTNEYLKLQLRNNSNDNWTSVLELNGADGRSENKSAFFDGFTILSLHWTNETDSYPYKRITLEGSVEPKLCTVEPQRSPDARCVLSNGNRIIDSSEERIFSIKGDCSFGLY